MHNADIVIKSLIRQHYLQNNKSLKRTLEIYEASYNLFIILVYWICSSMQCSNVYLGRSDQMLLSEWVVHGEPSMMIRIPGDLMYYTHIFRHSLSKVQLPEIEL